MIVISHKLQFNEMGININRKTNEVEFTDEHEFGVDTTTIPGTTIYSIFQRNDKLALDGNPLIYALKGQLRTALKMSWFALGAKHPELLGC